MRSTSFSMRLPATALFLAGTLTLLMASSGHQPAEAQIQHPPLVSASRPGTYRITELAFASPLLPSPTAPGQPGQRASRLAASRASGGPTALTVPGTGDLGGLGGTRPSSTGASINDAGQVAGWADKSAGVSHAFLWTPTTPNAVTGSMVDLGTLGGTQSYGYGVNASGAVAGGAYTSAFSPPILPGLPSDPIEHAFAWTGAMTDLATLGGTNSQAYALNDAGYLVGGAGDVDDNLRAFAQRNGVLTDLGTLGGNQSIARAINNAGQIAGWAERSDGTAHACLWQNAVKTDLGTLGGAQSYAFGINASGQTVGQADTTFLDTTLSPIYHACLWSGGVCQDLGTLGGGNSIAYAISNAGQVVGVSDTTTNSFHAFLWQNNTMVDLNTVLNDSTWTLSTANGINNVGQIVGYGVHTVNGAINVRAFLLTPNIPAALTDLRGVRRDGRVTLTWSPSLLAASYNVKRAITPGGPYTVVASGVTSASFVDTGVPYGTTAYYVVTGVNIAGESALSNPVTAAPVAALQGKVTLPGWVGTGQPNLVRVYLFAAGSAPTREGQALKTVDVTLGSGGAFTLYDGLATDGAYRLGVKPLTARGLSRLATGNVTLSQSAPPTLSALSCPIGDLNGDGYVDDSDLGTVIFYQGRIIPGADANGDGYVDDVDLGLVIFNQGRQAAFFP